MLKEFAAFLVNLGEDKTIVTKEINGETYAPMWTGPAKSP